MAMKKQMELFEEGGLMDEGGTVDPVSGNDVPPGSTQEEVRDDIPAQLSEGEFVFPADVVRYIGLENLMRMRQEAKQGLAQMEAMGQMGNGDEAVMPDDLPFDMYDLEVEDEQGELNFAVGGAVPAPGFTGIGAYTPPPPVTTGFTPYVAPTVPATGIQQQATPQVSYTTATGTTNLPTFQQTIGGSPGQYDEMKTYVNDAGQILQIPFKNGQPIYPIPEGYKLKTDDTTQPTQDTSTTPTTVTTQDGGDSGDDFGKGVQTSVGTTQVGSISDALKGLKSVLGLGGRQRSRTRTASNIFESAGRTTDAFGGSKTFGFSNEDLRNASFKQGLAQLGTFGVAGPLSTAAEALGIIDFNVKDIGIDGNTAMNAALNSMGLVNRTQLMNDKQASLVGNAMAAAHAASLKGQDPKAAYMAVVNSKEGVAVRDAALDSIKNSFAANRPPSERSKPYTFGDLYNEARGAKEAFERERADAIDRGRVVDRRGLPVTNIGPDGKKTSVMTEAGRAAQRRAEAKIKQARILMEQADSRAQREAAKAVAAAGLKDMAREGFEPGDVSDDAVRSAYEAADRAYEEAGFGRPDEGPSDSFDYGDEFGNIADDSDNFDDSFDAGESDESYSGGFDDSFDAGESDESYGDFNKGGLASQMKRSGLASKK